MTNQHKTMTPYESNDNVFFTSKDSDGKEYEVCIEENAVAKLLVDGVLFVGDSDSGPFFKTEKNSIDSTISVWVLCNDVFAWATADSEPITTQELPELYKMHMSDNKWGSVKWVCKKRNLQPQTTIIKDMKSDGSWCKLMESLPKNR